MQLPPGQQRVLDFLRDYLRRNRFPPTHREIQDALGFASPNAARRHLEALQHKGFIELPGHTARGIRLVASARRAAPDGLPLVGQVAAGAPILAVEHVERHVVVDPALFKPRADYLLRVHGDSMQGVGILDGDLVAVHRTPEARDGQIVVARIEDEVTVKRLRIRRQRVELHAENPAYAPIEIDPRRTAFAIEGLYVGMVRMD
jgi:repressor LexA